jgi:tetrathionate reductase subunit B
MMLEKGKYPYVSRSFLPSLCNHCDHPTCINICPVKATWQREDGIVMIDEQRCIGCKYCIASCPYNARYLNPLSRVVQKCFFCHHRIDTGLEPACVDTCLGKARIFGDLADRYSYIARLIEDFPVQVLKPQNGTAPQVYYIAADMAAMAPMVGYTI